MWDDGMGIVWGPACGEGRGQYTDSIVSGRGGDWHAVKDLMKVRSTWQSDAEDIPNCLPAYAQHQWA